MTTTTLQKGYKALIVWQESMNLAENIYKITGSFPAHELYGITKQMRTASVSIPSNIAEGSKRNTKKDFRRHIAIAYGSGAELQTQIELSRRIKYLTDEKAQELEKHLSWITAMLHKLSASLQKKKTLLTDNR